MLIHPAWDRAAQAVPVLGVEVGGGMAADYNHRVHLSSPDMPSMHLCDVANGFNMMGYCEYLPTSSLGLQPCLAFIQGARMQLSPPAYSYSPPAALSGSHASHRPRAQAPT